jgi:hypothetical protein
MARTEQLDFAARVALGGDEQYEAAYSAVYECVRVEALYDRFTVLLPACFGLGRRTHSIECVTRQEWLSAILRAQVGLKAEQAQQVDIADHLKPAFDPIAHRPVFVVTPAGEVRCQSARDLGRALDFATAHHLRAWVRQDNAPQTIEDAPTKPFLRLVTTTREGHA